MYLFDVEKMKGKRLEWKCDLKTETELLWRLTWKGKNRKSGRRKSETNGIECDARIADVSVEVDGDGALWMCETNGARVINHKNQKKIWIVQFKNISVGHRIH